MATDFRVLAEQPLFYIVRTKVMYYKTRSFPRLNGRVEMGGVYESKIHQLLHHGSG